MVKKMLDEKEKYRILQEGDWGSLATFGKDYPYVVPMNYIVNNGYIYFHSKPSGLKIENILRDGRSCFTVVNIIRAIQNVIPCKNGVRYKSVQVFGHISPVEN